MTEPWEAAYAVIYRGDENLGALRTPELAKQAVDAVNERAKFIETIIDVLCGQALADDLGDVRDGERKLWKLLGVDKPVNEHVSAWRNTEKTLKRAGLPLPEYLRDDAGAEDEDG